MSGRLLDSDIVSALLRRDPKATSTAAEFLSKRGKLALSVISVYEIRRGLEVVGATKQRARFMQFCETCHRIPLTENVCAEAAEIYATLVKSGQLIGDADILIAATALTKGLVVVTNNEQHFNRVPGLVIENWLR